MKLITGSAFPAGWGIHSLRAAVRDRDQIYFTDELVAQTITAATISQWRWHLMDRGEWVASFWVLPDPPDRGYVCMVVGKAADRINWRRKSNVLEALKHYLAIRPAYRELRCWVRVEDLRAKSFAEKMGFRVDCGPATGIDHDGSDANLMLWRR